MLNYKQDTDGPKIDRCLFSVIQFIPDLLRGEFVNIGIVIQNTELSEQNAVCFTHDWSRVQLLDPGVDIAMLASLEAEWQDALRESETFIDVLSECNSGCVQLTQPKAFMRVNSFSHMDYLMRAYVLHTCVPSRKTPVVRNSIYWQVRSLLDQQGIWQSMTTDLRASRYTHSGNPLVLDCGYKTAEVLHCIQTVIILDDNNHGIVLANSASSLRAGVQKLEGVSFVLTAVVDPPPRKSSKKDIDQYHYNVDLMEESGIQIVPVADIGTLASQLLSQVA